MATTHPSSDAWKSFLYTSVTSQGGTTRTGAVAMRDAVVQSSEKAQSLYGARRMLEDARRSQGRAKRRELRCRTYRNQLRDRRFGNADNDAAGAEDARTAGVAAVRRRWRRSRLTAVRAVDHVYRRQRGECDQ